MSTRAINSVGFQSTPPHGRRRFLTSSIGDGRRFQSTPPHGRRQNLTKLEDPTDGVSIHASAREATSLLLTCDIVKIVSIHASAREATYCDDTVKKCIIVSIHASAREATSTGTSKAVVLPRFNPRLRTGGDEDILALTTNYLMFQSTPPHGRRLIS